MIIYLYLMDGKHDAFACYESRVVPVAGDFIDIAEESFLVYHVHHRLSETVNDELRQAVADVDVRRRKNDG